MNSQLTILEGDEWIKIVNFKLSNEMWNVNGSKWGEHGQKRKSDSPTGRNRAHELLNTWWTLNYIQVLSYENSWRERSYNWVHMWQASCRLSTVEVILSSDKWIKMLNFKLSNEMWKVNWSTWTKFLKVFHFLGRVSCVYIFNVHLALVKVFMI